MDKNIWHLIHDGLLVNVEGKPPGDLTLTVEISYLTNLFSKDFEHLTIKLLDCEFFDFHMDYGSFPIKEYEKVSGKEFWLLNGDLLEGVMNIYCSEHLIKTRYQNFTIFLPGGQEITEEQLVEKAKQYWDNFGKN